MSNRLLLLLLAATLLTACASAPVEPLPTPKTRTGAEIAQKVSQDTDAQITKEGTRAVLHASSIKPKKKAPAKPTPAPTPLITLTIAKDGTTALLGGEGVAGVTLEEKLQSLHKANPSSKILLKSAPDVAYGRVIETMDLVRKLGFQDIQLTAEAPADPPAP